MAALSIGHSFHRNKNLTQERKSWNSSRARISMSQVGDRNSETKKEKRREDIRLLRQRVFEDVEKFGRGLKESLGPKQKGDWRDVMLMSLSFAVYVYVSQKIVCAYCAWMHMFKQSW